MVQRVHYRRKHTYRTRSNMVRKIRTPGGKLTVQYMKKTPKPIVCADTKKEIQGVKKAHIGKFKVLPRRNRTVSRVYGGSLSLEAVRFRIKRAFFNEELKVIKQGATSSKRTARKKQGRRR